MTDKLKELALAATPGPWWIDSHGHCMVSMTAGRKTIFVTNSEAMGPAVRHEDTGNLSHWRNDNDASYIAAASPDAILALISDLETERRKVTELVDGYEKDQAELKQLRTKLAAMESLLGAALGALRYHTEQTRPIKRTYETITAIEASVASLASGAAQKENT